MKTNKYLALLILLTIGIAKTSKSENVDYINLHFNERGISKLEGLDSCTSPPDIQFQSFESACASDNPINLENYTGVNPAGGKWVCINCNGFNPISSDSIMLFPETKPDGFNYVLQYRYNDASCSVTKLLELDVNPNPSLIVTTQYLADTFICETEEFVNLVGVPTGGTWVGEGIVGNQFIPDNVLVKDTAYSLKYTFTNVVTGCGEKDSVKIWVQSQPDVEILGDYPIKCQGLNFDSVVASYTNAQGIVWSVLTGQGQIQPNVNEDTIRYVPGSTDTASVILRVQTNQPGVCPQAEATINLVYRPKPNLSILHDTAGCESFEVEFLTNVHNMNKDSVIFRWNFGAPNEQQNESDPVVIFDYTPPDGRYNISLKASAGGACDTTLTTSIRVYDTPEADFSIDPSTGIITLDIAKFQFWDKSQTFEPPLSFRWDFGDMDISFEQNPIHKYRNNNLSDTGSYLVNLHIETQYGCMDTISKPVRIIPILAIYLPNAFTPDGNDAIINDYFFPIGVGFTSGTFKVFNRWGEKLHESTFTQAQTSPQSDANPIGNEEYTKIGWDGTYGGSPSPNGVYVYVVEVTSLLGEQKVYSGTFHLIR